MSNRNRYMLVRSLAERGYDWWWHSLTGHDAESGEPRGFFIEYFSINPGLAGKEPVYGRDAATGAENGQKPSYGMLNAGAWGSSPKQIHNYYPHSQCAFDTQKLDARIGQATVTEEHLQGSVQVTAEQALENKNWMSDAGSMSWELRAEKVLSYSVGFGADRWFRRANAFQMFWHVAGIKTEYDGEIVFDGRRYVVTPETSAGYQDKNWGQDFTNPWIWLNSSDFTEASTAKRLPLTCLDVGGGKPVLFGRRLPSKLLIAFYWEGRLYEFNFSKIWTGVRQSFECTVEVDRVRWQVEARNFRHRIEIDFWCPKDEMLFMNYENPDGKKRHHNLWNGGNARGTVRLFEGRKLLGEFHGQHGGGEYGEFPES